MTDSTSDTLTPAAAERLSRARRNLRRIEREIEPFRKPRRLRRPTTAGQWRDSKSILRSAEP